MAFLPDIYHPAAINARAMLANWGIGDPYGYRQDARQAAAASSSTSTSPYGYPSTDPAATADTGTGNVSGGSGMENVSGWAGRQGYEGSALNALYADPSAVIPDVIGNRAAAGPVGEMMTDIPYDPRSIYLMTAGNKRSSMNAGAEGYANWLGTDFYRDMARGGVPDLDTLLKALENPRPHSALGEMFAAGTAAEQINLFEQFLYDAAMASGLGPDVAAAILESGQDVAMRLSNRALSQGPNAKTGNLPRRLTRGLGF